MHTEHILKMDISSPSNILYSPYCLAVRKNNDHHCSYTTKVVPHSFSVSITFYGFHELIVQKNIKHRLTLDIEWEK